MTTTPRPSVRSLLLAALTAVSLAGLTACDLDVDLDSPLGADAAHRGFLVGTPVMGRVENPSGDITVTLARASLPLPPEGRNSRPVDDEVVACGYDDQDATYACPTAGLPQGLYRVEVTDADFPSEGTHLVDVALTGTEGYDPRLGATPPGEPDREPVGFADPAERAAVHLTGWMPGRDVTVRLFDLDTGSPAGRPVTVTPGADGTAVADVGRLAPGTYSMLGRDGLWDDRTADGWDTSVLVVGRG